MKRRIRTRKKLWENHQWAVTAYGLECCCGPFQYGINKNRLTERRAPDLKSSDIGDWPLHMADQHSWVDLAAFHQAWLKALEIHKPADAGEIDIAETLRLSSRERGGGSDCDCGHPVQSHRIKPMRCWEEDCPCQQYSWDGDTGAVGVTRQVSS